MIPIFHILIALLLPAYVIYKHNKAPLVRPYIFSCASFVLCCVGILMQIVTIKERLNSNDIGGIFDTIDAVIILSAIMLLFTCILNLLALGLSYEK